jgi:hypothetical protein
MPRQQVPERHRRVIRALESGPRAPDRLHRRIEEMQAEAARRPAARIPALHDLAAPSSRLRPAAVAAGVSALLLAALVVALSVGGPGASKVVQAAELSTSPATKPTPPADERQPGLLERTFAGVTFPAWTDEFGWRADGARSDVLDGRRTETVFYRHTHHRIAYTVISGRTLEPPEDAERLNAGGIELRRFRLGLQDVVTFERAGRTCVLSGDVHDPDTLVKLASWQGDGSVSF